MVMTGTKINEEELKKEVTTKISHASPVTPTALAVKDILTLPAGACVVCVTYNFILRFVKKKCK